MRQLLRGDGAGQVFFLGVQHRVGVRHGAGHHRRLVQALLRRFDILNLIFPMKNRSEPIYRVEPIIKAKLPAEMIAEIRERLAGEPKAETDPSPDANGSTSA